MKPMVTKWLVFAILLPLGPLVATSIARDTLASGGVIIGAISGGQLLLLGVALSCRSIGEVLPGSREFGAPIVAVIGLSAFVLVVATFYYAWISAQVQLPPQRVAAYSSAIYCLSIVVSFACVLVAKKIADA